MPPLTSTPPRLHAFESLLPPPAAARLSPLRRPPPPPLPPCHRLFSARILAAAAWTESKREKINKEYGLTGDDKITTDDVNWLGEVTIRSSLIAAKSPEALVAAVAKLKIFSAKQAAANIN